MSGLVWFLIILLVLAIIGGIGYGIYHATKKPSTPSTPSTPTAPTTGTQTGVWLKNPGTNYANGMNFTDAQTFCKNAGSVLATKDQLNLASTKGQFEYCACGWLDGQAAGYVMQTTKQGCGTAGFNTCPTDPTSKYGAYCYGLIPTSSDIVAFAAI